eukprot:TRINITY_DN2800_c0_g1_i1.p1 TRINITY_DN2800_c0_g1~~TRINITY_DN2800_c0_g1_i1.p1  ORF type:complete len:659 (-),score=105.32 TRINITY_DN2800_c0_g1_i1:534-2432(-)
MDTPVHNGTVIGFVPVGTNPTKDHANSLRSRTSLLSEQLECKPVQKTSQDLNTGQMGFRLLTSEERQLWYNTQIQYPVFDTPLAKEAFSVAARAFRGKNRLNGESVLVHAVETAKILAQLGCNDKMVAIALLHDVLDDSDMTEVLLAEFVPRDIVDKLLEVSKISSLSQLHREGAEHVSTKDAAVASNLYIAMADVEAVIVKLADRLHNMRTLGILPAFKRMRMAQETLDVFVPIANRLGIWTMKWQLEDLCFEHLYPKEFKHLSGVQNNEVSRDRIEHCLEVLQSKLAEKKVVVEDLYGRSKSLFSVFSKLQKKHSKASLEKREVEQLYDMRAIRIIVKSKADCYLAARQVERLWQPIPNRYKDYIRHPKENGYQSLHLVVNGPDNVPLEVQIRTAKMHYLAEYGVAAHWRYKEAGNEGNEVDDEQQAVLIRYKRWLTQKLKLYDMKCRPCGGTSFEQSFDSLRLDVDEVRAESAPSALGGGDAFTRYMEQCKLLPVGDVRKDETPVTVVCSTRQKDNSFRISYQVLPPKSSARDAFDKYCSDRQRNLELLVNNELVVDYSQELQNGDVIEVRERVEEAASQLSSASSGSSSSASTPFKLNLDIQVVDLWGSSSTRKIRGGENQSFSLVPT